MSETTLVIGAGPVGRAVTGELLHRGRNVVILTRSGTAVPGARSMAGSAAEPGDMRVAIETSGADRVINCMHAPYDAGAWRRLLIPAEQTVLSIAAERGVHVTFPESVYAFGEQAHTMTAASEIAATTGKPGIRAQLIDARSRANAPVCSVVASDLYGPGCGPAAVAHALIVEALKSARRPMALIDSSVPHPFTYLPDYARALADASQNHLTGITVTPTWDSVSQGEFAKRAAHAAGVRAREPLELKRWMLKLSGVFNRDIRGLVEMTWLWDSPRFVQGSYDWAPTDLDEGLRQTFEGA
ncbi:NAD-dependent epimerase/dehydratase family protein [Corynebacterium sanguinis]|uniref:NAD-dependent epimerase/dehydratase family protein n=1 Tax=Corynebacterium sanguinis TaxID=2594913 RepID=UPI0021AFF238|nr:NAD-dependent epimerase/dehydratase family protein [Corynebacterium sanguinis]MCT1414174.1 NAD-dependent epimerase/dehydratase family protein [Corynebacterium sanguinis]